MILCNANCRHRRGDQCNLALNNEMIIMNAVGQCEMKESPVDQRPLQISCTECLTEENIFQCILCESSICEDHTYYAHGHPHCLMCMLKYAPLGPSSDYQSVE
mgnify:FL=1